MDLLDDLPIDNNYDQPTSPSIDRYFRNRQEGKGGKARWRDKGRWKLLGLTIFAFLLLINPWVQSILSKTPYLGEEKMKIMALTTVLFLILMLVVIFYLC